METGKRSVIGFREVRTWCFPVYEHEIHSYQLDVCMYKCTRPEYQSIKNTSGMELELVWERNELHCQANTAHRKSGTKYNGKHERGRSGPTDIRSWERNMFSGGKGWDEWKKSRGRNDLKSAGFWLDDLCHIMRDQRNVLRSYLTGLLK